MYQKSWEHKRHAKMRSTSISCPFLRPSLFFLLFLTTLSYSLIHQIFQCIKMSLKLDSQGKFPQRISSIIFFLFLFPWHVSDCLLGSSWLHSLSHRERLNSWTDWVFSRVSDDDNWRDKEDEWLTLRMIQESLLYDNFGASKLPGRQGKIHPFKTSCSWIILKHKILSS